MKIAFLAKRIDGTGTTTHQLSLAEEYLKKGHKVAWITGGVVEDDSSKLIYEKIKELGVEICKVSFPITSIVDETRLEQLWKYLISIPKCLIFLKKSKIDIVHVHWPVTSYVAKIYSFIFKVPFVTTYHATNIPKHPLLKKADMAIAISREMQEEIVYRHGYKYEELELVYNGVDHKKFIRDKQSMLEFRNELKLSQEDIVITFIGTLREEKGIDILLQACSEIQENFKVFLVGNKEGVYREYAVEIMKMAEKYSLSEKVILTGFKDPYDYYNISDIFVLPSRREGFGLVSVEAMLMEVPVVRSDVGGAVDQIENESDGFIFENENVEQLRGYITELIKNKEIRKRVGKAGREKALKLFTQEKMAENTIKVYEKVLKK